MGNNSSEISPLNHNVEIVRGIHELVRSAENMKDSFPELIEDLKKNMHRITQLSNSIS